MKSSSGRTKKKAKLKSFLSSFCSIMCYRSTVLFRYWNLNQFLATCKKFKVSCCCSEHWICFIMQNKYCSIASRIFWRRHSSVVSTHIWQPGGAGEPRYLQAMPRKFCSASLWSCWLYFWNNIFISDNYNTNRKIFLYFSNVTVWFLEGNEK